jgi:hypothetical protein
VSSLRTQGPIRRGGCFEGFCSRTFVQHHVLWLWVPACAETTLNVTHDRCPTVIASEAKQSIIQRNERMDCFVASLLAMTSRHTSASPRRKTSEPLPESSALKTEGVGNAGCPLHPQPPVQQKSTGGRSHRYTGEPGIPARNGFNGFLRALPGDRALLSPLPLRSLLLKNLTPASRRQDHTTSPSASGALVRSTLRVHRIPPRVRDDRDTPLEWDETCVFCL